MPDFSGLEYLIGAIFLIAIKLGVAFSKEWITRRDDRHTRAAGLSEADLSAATWYRTSRGEVVGRLKDGRALVGMGKAWEMFASMEDFRVWSNDEEHWEEIARPLRTDPHSIAFPSR